MRIVFLIPYPVDAWLYLRDHWVTTESPGNATLAGRMLMENYAWEAQKELAEQKVAPARAALRGRGVDIAVDVYTGRLGEVVRSYARSGDVHLVTLRGVSGLRILSFLREMICLFAARNRPRFYSMAASSPGHKA